MKVAYQRLVEAERVLRHINALAPKTVVFDIEPLVAFWDTDQATLVRGVAAILDQVLTETAGVQMVVFATNSQRRLPAAPSGAGPRVLYLAAASKPLRTAPYRHLPRPGVVIGDQLATDGVLAWRLGYSFLHYRPARTPLGPRAMNLLGRPLRPILFTRAG